MNRKKDTVLNLFDETIADPYDSEVLNSLQNCCIEVSPKAFIIEKLSIIFINITFTPMFEIQRLELPLRFTINNAVYSIGTIRIRSVGSTGSPIIRRSTSKKRSAPSRTSLAHSAQNYEINLRRGLRELKVSENKCPGDVANYLLNKMGWSSMYGTDVFSLMQLHSGFFIDIISNSVPKFMVHGLLLDFVCNEDLYFELYFGNRLLNYGEGSQEVINSLEINADDIIHMHENSKNGTDVYGLAILELVICSINMELSLRRNKSKCTDPSVNSSLKSITFVVIQKGIMIHNAKIFNSLNFVGIQRVATYLPNRIATISEQFHSRNSSISLFPFVSVSIHKGGGKAAHTHFALQDVISVINPNAKPAQIIHQCTETFDGIFKVCFCFMYQFIKYNRRDKEIVKVRRQSS